MRQLPIHKRLHLSCDDKTTTRTFVHCPEDGRWAPTEACRRCEKLGAMHPSSIECAPAGVLSAARAPEDVAVVEVVDDTVLCVDAGATVESVCKAFDEVSTPLAIVVDADRHAVGVCSRRDLLHRSGTRRVGTCMTPFLITLLGTARVADAIELIVGRGLSHVPVLTDGAVVGLVTPRAVIRWLVQSLRVAGEREQALRPM